MAAPRSRSMLMRVIIVGAPGGGCGSPYRSATDVSVYVIHWNAPQWCSDTVTSFLGCEGIDVDVCVVDNGPPECSDEVRHLLPPAVRIIGSGANSGFTGGANAALRDWFGRVDDAIVVIASHDVRLAPGALRTLVDALERDGRLGIVGPQGGRIGDAINDVRDASGVRTTAYISGSCMVMRRACVLDVGPFDERFGSYGEDVDYCLRASDLGWQVGRVAGITMGFHGSRSSSAHELGDRNAILLALKRGGPAAALRRASQVMVALARNGAGSVTPWRSPADRSVSRRRLRSRASALVTAGREVHRHGVDGWRHDRSVPSSW
jgi:N-acetylglucosaminyl-diphospho-decaprenol L-rhamnosyltransferase